MSRTPTTLFFIAALVTSLLAGPACQAASGAPTSREEMVSRGLKGQMTTILLGGLAGAAMGLSTLSFYGRPQAKLTHIPIGAAIGLVTGTIYSTYQMVVNPAELMNSYEPPNPSPEGAVVSWTVSF